MSYGFIKTNERYVRVASQIAVLRAKREAKQKETTRSVASNNNNKKVL